MTIKCSASIAKWYQACEIILAVALLLPSMAHADAEVKFHGTLIAASCTPDATSVEFGDVTMDTVAVDRSASPVLGVRAAGAPVQQFNLTFSCTGNVDEIKYKWSGTTSSFDNTLLATDMQGLGIEIGDGDTSTMVPPDIWESLAKDARSKNFIAILVRDPNATLVGGEFNATATFAIQVP